jgi:molecular chaperone GrpE
MEENTNTSELEEVKKQLEEAKEKCEEYLNGWKRERADFLNYKKDEMERIGQLVKYSEEELILKIIPILDNIYLAARQNFSTENLDGQETVRLKCFHDGLLQIIKQLEDFLAKEGIEPIKTVGEPFDPNFMEAVGEAEGGDEGTIIEEVQRGYTMNGKLIRVAKVRVTK